MMETYQGHVRTPNDAILLFEACRIGLLPRVQRRLSEKERQQIKSGSVFVWDEREAGMRRWTDGKSWSASRVSGSFLTYREMEGKRGGSSAPAPKQKSPNGSANGAESEGEGPDGYRYKPDGLMKQSFSITTASGQHLHLISYFSRSGCSNLQQPSNDPSLRQIRPPKNMYPESTVNETQSVPAVTRGPMAGSPSPYTPAAQSIPPSSPYRPGNGPTPIFAVYHPHPHTPPNGNPPFQPAYYSQLPYGYPQLVYAQHPYAAQAGQVFDRPPPPQPPPGHSFIAPNHGYGGPPTFPGQTPPQYIAGPPARAMQTHEIPNHQPQAYHQRPPQNDTHTSQAASTLPEKGVQLPALTGAASSTTNKPPSPQPVGTNSQESSTQVEANGANNTTQRERPLPTVKSILNGNSEETNQPASRSGSRSPNNSQRAARELPPDRIASNSTVADSRALNKLNSLMFSS